MALSLPTTSNTVGGLSNVALVANLSSTFELDSNFSSITIPGGITGTAANTYGIVVGRSSAISANGDYLVLSTTGVPTGKTYTNSYGTTDPGGVVVLLTRSGNTWTQDRSFVSGDLVSGSNQNTYGSYHSWPGAMYNRSVSIDDAGENILITGGENQTQGRIEFWNRSGSTWSRVNSFDGSSNEKLGFNGVMLAGNGLSAIVLANKHLKRYTNSGGSWSVDSTHGTYTPTDSGGTTSNELWNVFIGGSTYDGVNSMLQYNTDGTKYIWTSYGPVGTIRINTRYYDGSSWQTSTPTTIDLSSIISYSGYTNHMGFTMSQDGNYCFVGMECSSNISLVVGFVWNSGTNSWTQQQFFDLTGQESTARVGLFGPLLTNQDGSKLIAGPQISSGARNTDYMWRCWERSGSTWTLKNKYHYMNGNQLNGQTVAQANNGPTNQTSGYTQGAMSKDGLHIIFTHPNRNQDGDSSQVGVGSPLITYFQPTGITQSSVSNGQIATHQGRRFRYNSAKGRWTPANRVNLTGVETTRTRSAGVASSDLSGETLSINGLTVDVGEFAGKTTTYANASIFPFSSLQAGDQAIALDTGYLYVTDGSGWFRVANSAIVT